MSHAIKLKHVLHFYEEVETTLHTELIERTHTRYKMLLEEEEHILLLSILNTNIEINELVRDALARFCIRQL